MKKTVLLLSIVAAAALVALAGYAAAGSSTAAEALSSPEAAAIALEDDGVLIEVLHARLCPAHRRHGESRFIQEISGRVLSTGKKVREFRPGAYVGFLGEIVPCGRCSACSAGHRESCRNAGRVCDSTCRGHDGRCRNRIITQECNLVKFNGDEAASEQFSRLCGTPAPCPQLRCHVPATDSAAVSGGCRSHTRRHHCR